MSEDWLTDDPFADENDPAAQERAERRAERESRRREKAEKEGVPPPPEPQQPQPQPQPQTKRSPEQEFWDEDPSPEPAAPRGGSGAASSGGAAEGDGPPGRGAPGGTEQGGTATSGGERRSQGRLSRLFGRGREKAGAKAPAAGVTAAKADRAGESSRAAGADAANSGADGAKPETPAKRPGPPAGQEWPPAEQDGQSAPRDAADAGKAAADAGKAAADAGKAAADAGKAAAAAGKAAADAGKARADAAKGEPEAASSTRGRPAGNARRLTPGRGSAAPDQGSPAPPPDQGSPPPAPGHRSTVPDQGPAAQDQGSPAPDHRSAAANRRASAAGRESPAPDREAPAPDPAPQPPPPGLEPPGRGTASTEPGSAADPVSADHATDPPDHGHAADPPSDEATAVPVPVGADPTRPAGDEEPIPDPGAPRRGQTSEEWAMVPGPRSDDFSDFQDEGDPQMAGAARSGRRSGDGGRRRRGGPLGALLRHPFRVAAVIVLIAILYLLNALFQPFHGDGSGHVGVRIPKGASVSEVGEILERRGVIDGPAIGPDAATMFQIRVTLAGKRSDLFAGRFALRKDMSYGDAIEAISKEPKAAKPAVTTVTVPEGYTRGQAAQIVREDGVPGNYKKATVKSKYLNPARYGGKQAKTLEGFLFPDTFELKPNQPVKDLVQLQLRDFKKKIKKVNMKYAKSKNLTVFDVVTIASMVEREAGVPKQRKLVASVIYNRLREGIPLGIDATIRFATGNYERPLTESQLATDSPYNTRTNAGLPPGPINSPGLAALRAAAHPAETGYLYYVNDPASCNELTFAKTEAEFEAAVAKYERAREANGGNAPSTCGE